MAGKSPSCRITCHARSQTQDAVQNEIAESTGGAKVAISLVMTMCESV